MKITMVSTDVLFSVDGVPCRLWNGTTEQGTACQVLVRAISVPVGTDPAEFQEDLIRREPAQYLGPMQLRPGRN